MAATVVALVLLLGLFVGAAFSNSFEVPERDHLEPIPIDVAACPYVTAMHDAANQFQIAYPTLGTAYDANQQPLTWQETQVRLDRASAVLEYTIAASVERFPTQVQRYLMSARDALTEGRAQLSVASSGSDFATRTSHLLQEGQLAFGYAGDLIGSQCPVPLRADSDTMLYPFLTSTVPANAPAPQ
jgi:hypothetical protein